MRKFISLLCIAVCLLQPCMAQSDKTKLELSPEVKQQLLSAIKPDTAKILRDYSTNACHCIDSFISLRKAGDGSNPVEDIKHCISEETIGYLSVMKIYQSLISSEKDIVINTNENSPGYKSHYTDIEHWLMDSCAAIKMMLASNNEKETELSYSENEEAIKQYNLGIKLFTKENYAEALPYFKKALQADDKFVFAWDNLAICYRRTNDLDKALSAYNKSLELSPKGRTPLQNIPVIYELKKEYSKALEGYKKFLQYYPNDAEAYYGMGRICISFIDDLEKGVDYMCKAYNIYTTNKSPYRVDAETNLSYAYKKMKEQGKEEVFFKILKDNNISTK